MEEFNFDPMKPFGYAYDDPNNPYGWPYSSRCPECGAMAMKDDKCTVCGEDQHQEKCPECGTWQNHRHFEQYGGKGCVRCQPEQEYKNRLQMERDRYDQMEIEHLGDYGNKALKASELIAELQKLIEQYGDLDVYAEMDYTWVSYVDISEYGARGKYFALEA